MRREDKYKNQQANRPNPENRLKELSKKEIEMDGLRDKLYRIISSIFPDMERFYMSGDGINFFTKNYQITFDQLQKLSIALGTTHINLDEPEKISDGCGSCGYGAEYIRPIYCGKIDFNKFKD